MVRFAPRWLHSLRSNLCGTTSILSLFSTQNVRRNGTTWTDMHSQYHSSAVEASEFEGDELRDDGKTTEKDNALLTALSQLSGDSEKESSLSLNRFFGSRRASVISTGSLKLDIALGIGGLPKGRFVEIYGREASGKTTLALHIIKEAQKLGGYCAYLDVENALDPCLAESIGVNTKNLLISQPDSAENLLSVVNTLTISGSVDVIVVDSVAALIPQRELDALDFMTDFKYDIRSEIMTKALRKIHYSLCRSETLIVFVNQVRSNVKAARLYGPIEEVTCGGNALRFYSAVRLKMMRKGLLKVGDKVTGLGVCIEVVKNKLAPAMKKAELDIEWGRGITCDCELVLELACQHGVVLIEGNSYFIEGHVVNNKLEAERFLAQNESVANVVVKKLRSELFQTES